MKKGMTLVEVTVAMGLFAVVATIAIGAFVMVLNMNAFTSSTKETQQKLRMAIEIVSRLSRQANEISLPSPNNDKTLFLYFDGTPRQGTKFEIKNFGGRDTLTQADCTFVGGICTWTDERDLLYGLVDLDMTKPNELIAAGPGPIATSPPSLSIFLSGRINSVNPNPYYSDEFSLKDKVIFEGLRFP